MKRLLVTGGGGFVGKTVARMAMERGYEVTVIGRSRYPDIEKDGIKCVQGDIRDYNSIDSACGGVDCVVHVAALAGIWGPWKDYFSINVQGTENVITACRKNSIQSLVYTSTPSVVFNRSSIEGGNESLPYPDMFLCNYAKSKVIAEKMVLGANSAELATCAIRPHLVWGPGDPHLVPRLLAKGRRKELKIVGSGQNRVDISYVDNVAHAHLLAVEKLSAEHCSAGKAYFVSQGHPVNLWDWINDLFEQTGIERIKTKVPFRVAYHAGLMLETFHTLFRKSNEPKMTRFLAEQLAKSHYFSNANIEKDLGYQPVVSSTEGMEKLLEWIKENAI